MRLMRPLPTRLLALLTLLAALVLGLSPAQAFFQYGTAARDAANNAIVSAIGAAGTMELRDGTPPASCAAAATGTVVATIALPNPPLGASSGGTAALAGSWVDSAADANGRADYFRILNGSTCVIQGLVSDAWVQGRAYGVGDQVHNGGNLYRATTGGTAGATAPVHGSGTVSDGAVSWLFVQAGTDVTIQNATISAGQQVSITSFTTTMGGG